MDKQSQNNFPILTGDTYSWFEWRRGARNYLEATNGPAAYRIFHGADPPYIEQLNNSEKAKYQAGLLEAKAKLVMMLSPETFAKVKRHSFYKEDCSVEELWIVIKESHVGTGSTKLGPIQIAMRDSIN
jgi:hypothetical protein